MSNQQPSTAPKPQPRNIPPVTVHPTAHLDPGAYVRGSHAISIAPDTLVHPRVQLVSIHGPLIIDSGTVVYEKAILGGPIPSSASTITAGPNDRTKTSTPPIGSVRDTATTTATADDDGEEDTDDDPVKTLIGSNVYIGAHAQIHAGCTLHDACVIEPHAVVQRGVTVGAHAKVCGGCTVDRDVVDWEIVMEDGRRRRKRCRQGRPDGVVRSEEDLVEMARLKALQVDRESTMLILRAAARAAAAAKKK